jgi:hypothetical protein
MDSFLIAGDVNKFEYQINFISGTYILKIIQDDKIDIHRLVKL